MEIMSTMATIKERENLIEDFYPKKSGFTPRRLEKLTQTSLPKTMVNLECNHLLRTSRAESTHGHQSLEFQLWLEAGKHDPPFPKLADASYNSNVWRNFKGNYSFDIGTKGRSTSEAAAAAYPITIPKPSKIGEYTFGRFIKETPGLIKDNRLREVAINRTSVDKRMMEQLAINSYSRYPPIDRDGNIMPPEHYKKHPHYFRPIDDLPTTEYLVDQLRKAPPTPYGHHDAPIKYTPKRSPAWRFKLKSTNSNYQKALDEIRKHSADQHPMREPISRAKTCTPASTVD